MKISQLVILMMFTQILLQAVYYSTQTTSTSDFFDQFDHVSEQGTTDITGFVTRMKDQANWQSPFMEDVAAAFQNTFNLIFVGLALIGLILGNLFTVHYYIFTNATNTFLKIIGYVSVLIIGWFNIHMIVTVWKSLRGTNT